MLSFSQKESILRKSGIAIAPFPLRRLPPRSGTICDDGRRSAQQAAADEAHDEAVREWRAGVEALYLVWLSTKRD